MTKKIMSSLMCMLIALTCFTISSENVMSATDGSTRMVFLYTGNKYTYPNALESLFNNKDPFYTNTYNLNIDFVISINGINITSSADSIKNDIKKYTVPVILALKKRYPNSRVWIGFPSVPDTNIYGNPDSKQANDSASNSQNVLPEYNTFNDNNYFVKYMKYIKSVLDDNSVGLGSTYYEDYVKGFYFAQEYPVRDRENYYGFMNNITSYVKFTANKQILWVPYYMPRADASLRKILSSNYFSYLLIQPQYYFKGTDYFTSIKNLLNDYSVTTWSFTNVGIQMEVDNPQNTNNQKLYYEPNPNDPKNPRRLIDTYDINTVYSIVASRYAKYESTFIPLKQYTYSYYAGQPEDLSAEATHISYFFNKVKN